MSVSDSLNLEPLIPSHVVLEIAATCNLHCLGCAIHGPMKCVTRPVGVMPTDVWQTAIDEIGGWGKPLTLSLNGGGEPLLHKRLADITCQALSYPQLEIGFLTNGMLFDEQWASFVVDNQMDWIAFSVDGVDPQDFNRLRQGGDFELVEANLVRLLELKKKTGRRKPQVLLNMVAYDDIVDQEEAFVSRWIEKVDKVMVSYYRNPPSSRRWPEGSLIERQPCPFLWSQIVIAWDGRIGLCCEDFNIDIELGRVGQGSLLDAWNGTRMAAIRAAHQVGEYAAMPLCHDCDTWADRVLEETIDNKKQIICARRLSQKVYTSMNKMDKQEK